MGSKLIGKLSPSKQLAGHITSPKALIGKVSFHPSESPEDQVHKLIGKLSPPRRLVGTLTRPLTLVGKLSFSPSEFPIYPGPYTVNPSASEDIVLDTSAKVLVDDVTVKKIYYSETTNLSGGKTVYIA